MPKYVDGYVLPVPKKHLKAYRELALRASKIWREHGALEYRECVGEDLGNTFCRTFPKELKAKRGETVVFAYIVFKSRAHRDKVNAKAMNDPRLMPPDPKKLPFDCRRMLYGGFETLVDSAK